MTKISNYIDNQVIVQVIYQAKMPRIFSQKERISPTVNIALFQTAGLTNLYHGLKEIPGGTFRD